MTEATNWTKVTIYISKKCFLGGFFKFPDLLGNLIKFLKKIGQMVLAHHGGKYHQEWPTLL